MFVDLNDIDLTGSNPNFVRSDIRRVVFRSGQVIEFNEPIFANTIKVLKIEGTTVTALQSGIDFTIPIEPSEHVAYDAISDAKARASAGGNTFDRNLVKAIVMSTEFNGEYQVSISGNALYRRYSDYTNLGGGPEYSRALGASIIERLNYIEMALNPLSRITTTELGKVSPLTEDLTAAAEENFIKGEVHKVNVPNNVYVIRPLYGDFYDTEDLKIEFTGVEERVITDAFIGKTIVKESGEIVLDGNNIYDYVGQTCDVKTDTKTLIRDTDYIVRGIERAKTRIALVPNGVYSNIILTKKYRGECVITYHAFGGNVSIRDIYTIKDTLMNLVLNMTGSTYITKQQFDTLPKITSMIDRIEKLEDVLHVHRPVAIPYDYQFEDNGDSKAVWVDIAKLYHYGYTQDGTIPNVYTETFRLVNDAYDYDAIFDLTYELGSGALFITNTSITAHKFDSVGANYFNTRRTPMFRVVYDKANVDKGLVLQMAVISDVEAEDLWQIHLCHYNEALWSLIDKDGAYREDTTYNTTLPSGHRWGTNISNMVATKTAILSDPYTVFAGSIGMDFIDGLSYRAGVVYDNIANGTNYDDEPAQVELDGLTIDAFGNTMLLDPSNIYGFRFTVYDRYEGKYITKCSNITKGSSNSAYGEVVYFELDMCQISAGVKLVNDKLTLHIKSHTGTNSLESKRFDLRQIDVLFNEREV